MRTRLLAGATALALLGAGAAPAQADNRDLPTRVVVRDGTTSPPAVDVSTVTLEASWYWASQQVVRVRIPGGARPGQRLTIWFDVDRDATPEGRYDLRLGEPRTPGGTRLRIDKRIRAVDSWSLRGGRTPVGDPGAWRAAVRLGKGARADLAPGARTWSAPVRGWKPCDPAGGAC